MKQKILVFFFLIISFILLYLFYSNLNINNQQINNVCFENNSDNICFNVELAITYAEKSEGLMFREFLNHSDGMLFVYDSEKKYSFWMKNTLIPLDIIWINSDYKIVTIKTAYPCIKDEECISYAPDEKAQYVLEINANLTDKYDIHIGETAEFV